MCPQRPIFSSEPFIHSGKNPSPSGKLELTISIQGPPVKQIIGYRQLTKMAINEICRETLQDLHRYSTEFVPSLNRGFDPELLFKAQCPEAYINSNCGYVLKFQCCGT